MTQGRPPFPKHLKDMADAMGITAYQQFTIKEAAEFLRCSASDLEKLTSERKIQWLQVTDNQVDFFGYQLLQYLSDSVTGKPPEFNTSIEDRILRSPEVEKMTGLSRPTIWRREQKDDFPARISLGGNCVGWRLSAIDKWIRTRQ